MKLSQDAKTVDDQADALIDRIDQLTILVLHRLAEEDTIAGLHRSEFLTDATLLKNDLKELRKELRSSHANSEVVSELTYRLRVAKKLLDSNDVNSAIRERISELRDANKDQVLKIASTAILAAGAVALNTKLNNNLTAQAAVFFSVLGVFRFGIYGIRAMSVNIMQHTSTRIKKLFTTEDKKRHEP